MLFLGAWPAMPDRHPLQDDDCPLLNQENALWRILHRLVGLHNGLVRPQSSYDDLYPGCEDDTCLCVHRLSNLNDGAANRA